MARRLNILLDMDGVLADFFTAALQRLNLAYPERAMTIERYREYFGWDLHTAFECSIEDMWAAFDEDDGFWLRLQPFPWAKKLYTWLSEIGDVTIATSPSYHAACSGDKMSWISGHLGIPNSHMMVGKRKYLMARPGTVLIDDFPFNIDKFNEYGGQGILIPSNWNTADLTFEIIKDRIEEELMVRAS